MLFSDRFKLIGNIFHRFFCFFSLWSGSGSRNVNLAVASSPKCQHLCHLLPPISKVCVDFFNLTLTVYIHLIRTWLSRVKFIVKCPTRSKLPINIWNNTARFDVFADFAHLLHWVVSLEANLYVAVKANSRQLTWTDVAEFRLIFVNTLFDLLTFWVPIVVCCKFLQRILLFFDEATKQFSSDSVSFWVRLDYVVVVFLFLDHSYFLLLLAVQDRLKLNWRGLAQYVVVYGILFFRTKKEQICLANIVYGWVFRVLVAISHWWRVFLW